MASWRPPLLHLSAAIRPREVKLVRESSQHSEKLSLPTSTPTSLVASSPYDQFAPCVYSIKIAFAIASFGAAPLGISTFFSPFFPLLFPSLTGNFLYFPACTLPPKGRCETLAYKLCNLYSYTLYEYYRRVPAI